MRNKMNTYLYRIFLKKFRRFVINTFMDNYSQPWEIGSQRSEVGEV
jgi:hypothetical protein